MDKLTKEQIAEQWKCAQTQFKLAAECFQDAAKSIDGEADDEWDACVADGLVLLSSAMQHIAACTECKAHAETMQLLEKAADKLEPDEDEEDDKEDDERDSNETTVTE